MYILYGISRCSTVKKALTCLNQANIPYRFHDYRVEGIDVALIQHLADAVGWQTLLNRRSTSWRNLSPAQRSDLSDNGLTQLFLQYPTLIKRPILQMNQRFIVGFDPAIYAQLS
jgi:Spx/MgsR family transcriptional regulator